MPEKNPKFKLKTEYLLIVALIEAIVLAAAFSFGKSSSKNTATVSETLRIFARKQVAKRDIGHKRRGEVFGGNYGKRRDFVGRGGGRKNRGGKRQKNHHRFYGDVGR